MDLNQLGNHPWQQMKRFHAPPAIRNVFPEVLLKLVCGRVDIVPEVEKIHKTVRVWHCSLTDSDSLLERDHLLTHMYPLLRTMCAEQGCDLEVHDLTWGLQGLMSSTDHEIHSFSLSQLQNLLKHDSDAIIVVK